MKIALSAALLAASLLLTGCSLLAAPSAPSPTPTQAAEETPAASDPFLYTDDVAGFSITFPAEPTIEPIQGNEAGAQRASYSTTVPETDPKGVYYTAGGTTKSEAEVDVADTMSFLLASGRLILTDEDVVPETFELDGLPAIRADITMYDGKPATLVMAGEGHSFYQLQVIGGTPEQRQAFFDTFELLD